MYLLIFYVSTLFGFKYNIWWVYILHVPG